MSNDYDRVMWSRTKDGGDEMEFPVKALRQLSVPDINQGSYAASQVRFNTQNVGSSTELVDWSRSFLRVPITISLTTRNEGEVKNANAMTHYWCTLKNSVTSIIDSLVISSGGVDLVSKNGNVLNQYISFVLLTTTSPTDIDTNTHTFFRPDDSCSYKYDAEDGEINTTYAAALGLMSGQFRSANIARIRRQFDNVVSLLDHIRSDMAAARMNQIHANYSADTLDSNSRTWNIELNIPLTMMHDLFKKLPLTRSANFQFLVNVHAPATCVIAYDAGDVGTVTSTTPNGFLPFNVTHVDTLNDVTYGVESGATATYKLSIGNVHNTQCSLELMMVELSVQNEAALIRSPIRDVYYLDVYSFQDHITNLASGSTINSQIVTGISKLRRLVVVPRRAVNGSANVFGDTDTRLSPFSTAGCTVTPNSISDLQISVSGRPLYQQPINYGYDQFMMNVYGQGAMNGGYDRGFVGAGLLSKAMWDGAYGYIVVDLTRKDETEDVLEKQLTLHWVNMNSFAMSYDIYVEYQRTVKIDCFSGRIVI